MSETSEKVGQGGLLARTTKMQSFWIFVVLVVIIAFFTLMAPTTFATYNNVMNIVQNVSIWAVIAVGMTYIIITAGIDLSVGSLLVFSSVVSARVMEMMGGEGWLTAIVGMVVALIAGVAWGLFNGFIVAKAKVPPLIVTLGSLSLALGAAQVITGGLDIRSAPDVLQDVVGYGRLAGVPVISIIALSVVVVGGIWLHKTRFGRYTYAIGSNETAARRVGISVDKHLILVYALGGLLCGLAGILSLAQYGTTTIAGQSMTNLNVITAVVIGGTSIFGGQGSMLGTMIGLFIPAVLQSGFVIIGVSPYWQTVAVGAILIAAVYVDQQRRSQVLRGGKPRAKEKQRTTTQHPATG